MRRRKRERMWTVEDDMVDNLVVMKVGEAKNEVWWKDRHGIQN